MISSSWVQHSDSTLTDLRSDHHNQSSNYLSPYTVTTMLLTLFPSRYFTSPRLVPGSWYLFFVPLFLQ